MTLVAVVALNYRGEHGRPLEQQLATRGQRDTARVMLIGCRVTNT
jgi:hypothetical protein